MTRYYVTVTWDNWPEGGSCGEVIEAETYEAACDRMFDIMANYRAEDADPEDYEVETVEQLPAAIRACYEDEWHIVDCYDLDEHIANHARPVASLQAVESQSILGKHDGVLPDDLKPSHWAENATYPVEDWKYEVANDDTRQSYAEWVTSKREAEEENYEAMARDAGWESDNAGIFHANRGAANGTGDPVEYADSWREACEISGLLEEAA
jgi:hypothetical protein